MVWHPKAAKKATQWKASFLTCLLTTYFCHSETTNAFSSSTSSSHRLFSAHIRKYYINIKLEKNKTKMQCKKNYWGLLPQAFQVKNHVHWISSVSVHEAPKEPSLGCSWAVNFLFTNLDLSGLSSSDILRFLQVRHQVNGAEVIRPWARVDAGSNLKVTTVLEPSWAPCCCYTHHPASPPLRASGSSFCWDKVGNRPAPQVTLCLWFPSPSSPCPAQKILWLSDMGGASNCPKCLWPFFRKGQLQTILEHSSKLCRNALSHYQACWRLFAKV